MLQKWIFTHVNQLIKTGTKRKLVLNDQFDLPNDWKIIDRLDHGIQIKQSPLLIKTIIRHLRPQIRNIIFLLLSLMVFRFSVPILLKTFLNEISSNRQNDLFSQFGLAFSSFSVFFF
jgi:hypothetical protein